MKGYFNLSPAQCLTTKEKTMQQFKLSFYLRSGVNKDGTRTVVVRMYLNGDRMFLTSTDISVNPNYWDSKLERVKLKTAP